MATAAPSTMGTPFSGQNTPLSTSCPVQSAFKDTPDVKEFLFNPMVEEKKKRDLMKSLADDAGLSKHTLNFMYLLLDQGRLFSIAEIFDQFEIQYCKLTDTQVTALQLLYASRLATKSGSANSSAVHCHAIGHPRCGMPDVPPQNFEMT